MKFPFWIKALIEHWKKNDTEQKFAYQVSFTCPICQKEHLIPHIVETVLRNYNAFNVPIKCPNNTENGDIMFVDFDPNDERKLKVTGPIPLPIRCFLLALDLK